MNFIPMRITAYRCEKCGKMHKVASSVGKRHLAFIGKLPPNSFVEETP